MPASFGSRPFFRFLHKGLGLKNLADYIEQRQKLLGLTNLDVRTVIDVGANKGRAARRFRRLFPEARVYCVEPIPRLCRRLEQWAETEGDAVRVFELALARAPSEQPLYVHRQSDILSTLAAPAPGEAARYEPIPVQVETLDRLAAGLRLEPDVLVKLDTEGLDLEVIRGGEKTLRGAAAVIVEAPFYPNAAGDGAPTFEDIAAALRDLGYVYRGNVRLGCRHGTPMLADVLFARREAAERLAARA